MKTTARLARYIRGLEHMGMDKEVADRLEQFDLGPRSREIRAMIRTTAHVHITAREVASSFSISIQNASQLLVKLENKDYLTRTSRSHPTGGEEYLYKENTL